VFFDPENRLPAAWALSHLLTSWRRSQVSKRGTEKSDLMEGFIIEIEE
jgi:hypothetical protein